MENLLVAIYWMFAGITLYAGISHLMVGLHPPRKVVHLTFSALCFSMVGFTIAEANMLGAETIGDYVSSLRWNLTFALGSFLAGLLFMARYTRVAAHVGFSVLGAAFSALLLANALMPHTLQYTALTAIHQVVLPGLGEVTRVEGVNGPLFHLASLIAVADYAFIFYLLSKAYSATGSRSFLAMRWSLVPLLLSTLAGIVSRMDILDIFELSSLAFPGMILVMSMVLVKEHRHIEMALAKSEYRHRMLFEHANDAIVILRGETIIECNDRTVEMFNATRDTLIGTTLLAVSPEYQHDRQNSAQALASHIESAYQGNTDLFEWKFRRLTGDVVDVEIGLNGLELEDDWYLLAMIHDISERKISEARLNHLAFHDSLTGLPNRLLARERFNVSISLAHRAHDRGAMLFMDLDKFKIINDTLGHNIGDELLKAAALRLEACLRESDTLSRHGGDEFLVLLTQVNSSEQITITAEKLLRQFDSPFSIDGHIMSTSISIGIAVYPDDGEEFETLLKSADTAMYHAKESGRNAYRYFTEEMNIIALETHYIRNCLRDALEHHEFALYYQPQIDLASDRVVGAEALLRWHHPQMGVVAPERFIPVAEDCGLMVKIGDWVLSQACEQAASWLNHGLSGIAVAVNVSMVQFRNHDIENSVARALANASLAPELLQLELTESVMIRDLDLMMELLQRLKRMGISLAIDDFGTGYSSLAYLKRLNVDKLKIDQSFVRHMTTDENDAAIVRAVIQMAHSLHLKTVAEGVEKKETLEQLRAEQCDEIQGFLYGKPMPADEFVRFVRERAMRDKREGHDDPPRSKAS